MAGQLHQLSASRSVLRLFSAPMFSAALIDILLGIHGKQLDTSNKRTSLVVPTRDPKER